MSQLHLALNGRSYSEWPSAGWNGHAADQPQTHTALQSPSKYIVRPRLGGGGGGSHLTPAEILQGYCATSEGISSHSFCLLALHNLQPEHVSDLSFWLGPVIMSVLVMSDD